MKIRLSLSPEDAKVVEEMLKNGDLRVYRGHFLVRYPGVSDEEWNEAVEKHLAQREKNADATGGWLAEAAREECPSVSSDTRHGDATQQLPTGAVVRIARRRIKGLQQWFWTDVPQVEGAKKKVGKCMLYVQEPLQALKAYYDSLKDKEPARFKIVGHCPGPPPVYFLEIAKAPDSTAPF